MEANWLEYTDAAPAAMDGDTDMGNPDFDDLVERLLYMAKDAIRVEHYLGRILASSPFEFKDRSFINRVMTTKYILQVKVACPLDTDMYSYDPWSKDWLDHLGPRLMSCKIIKEAMAEDPQVAALLDAMRICALNEKPNYPIPIPPEETLDLFCAPSEQSFNELIQEANKPQYRRFTTRK